GKRIRQHQRARIVCDAVEVLVDREWKSGHQVEADVIEQVPGVKDAVAPSQHRAPAAEGTPGKARARSKTLVVGVNQRSWQAVVAGERDQVRHLRLLDQLVKVGNGRDAGDDDLIETGNEIGHAVIFVVRRIVDLVAQSQIQRERASYLEVVVHKQAVNHKAQVVARGVGGEGGAVQQAEQEIADGVAGPAILERDGASRVVEVGLVEQHARKVEAPFQ